MKQIPISEDLIYGAISFNRTPDWIEPWRLPYEERALYPSPDEALLERASTTAGVRLRFATDATAIGLATEPYEEPRPFDFTIDGDLIQTVQQQAGSEEVTFDGLPSGHKTVELWLPQRHGTVRMRSLLVDGGSNVEASPDDRPKWVAYGSSITHCAQARSPACTWPAIAARAKGMNLTCLGYGGNCHIEPMVARVIRDREADFISLKLGINVYGAASLGPRTFKAAVIGLVRIIREAHADTPIVVISPIASPPRETTRNPAGFTLQGMRDDVEDAVRRMQDTCGDSAIRYVDGLKLFGPDLAADYLPDELHPNADAQEIIARNVLEHVLP
jgi:hypothetical protein